MTLVKICGITNLADARYAVESGADQIGFNFYFESPRFISPNSALDIADKLPKSVLCVGVFVNELLENVMSAASNVPLDVVQLHGDEDNRFIEEVHTMTGLPVIKALRIFDDFDIGSAKNSSADAILLDKYSPSARGGTGQPVDWNLARQIREVVDRVYLAGGLNQDNVQTAIRAVRPWAVDVASGVESSPGKKDPKKVFAFIKAAKEAI
jgi:phosphoribosylanthranilate isomerase